MRRHQDHFCLGGLLLDPGQQVLTVSIDAVPYIFKAMAEGDASATVELTPDMAGPALDLLLAYKRDGKAPPKWVQTPTRLFTPETAAAEYERRKDLY